MKQELVKLLTEVLKDLGVPDVIPEVELSDNSSHGEYTTNVAMKLAGKLKKSPMDIALEVKNRIKNLELKIKAEQGDQNMNQPGQTISRESCGNVVLSDIDRVEVVKPGFINFFFSEAKLSTELAKVLKQGKSYGMIQKHDLTITNADYVSAFKKVTSTIPVVGKAMVEFAHPNTHKAFHIGHLRNIMTGETIVRLLESQGVEVIRANYQGDVGMHIAKALYGILHQKELAPELPALTEVRTLSVHEKVEYLGKVYPAGSKAYEESDDAKTEIGEINKKIYAKDPEVYSLYQETRGWSLEYFQSVYQRVGTHYDRLYFESEVYESGKANVLSGLEKGIFEKSDGAIIFPGEKFGLHNRVFITSEGNPTYEGKEMGLGPLQFSEYHPDLVIHVVSKEQIGYFQVTFEALAQQLPEARGKEYHLVYGWVRLKEGKMSSRLGQVVLGEWLLDEVKKEIYNILETSAAKYTKEEQENIAEKAAVAAVKYSFLKVSTLSDIAFDFKESININGDSGPYLLYTYARCKSVLRKAIEKSSNSQNLDFDLDLGFDIGNLKLNEEEHAVSRLISQFPDIVHDAAANFAPNLLATYLNQLAQAFNLFYAKHSILENRESRNENSEKDHNSQFPIHNSTTFRLALTAATAQILQNGLHLLGIETVERM